MTLQEAKARLRYLDRKIAEYPHWGAALTAMDEERKALFAWVQHQERRGRKA